MLLRYALAVVMGPSRSPIPPMLHPECKVLKGEGQIDQTVGQPMEEGAHPSLIRARDAEGVVPVVVIT